MRAMLDTATRTNNSNAVVITANHKGNDQDRNWSTSKDLYNNNEYKYGYCFEFANNVSMMNNNNNTNNNNQHIIISDGGMTKCKKRSSINDNNNNEYNDDELDVLVFGLVWQQRYFYLFG